MALAHLRIAQREIGLCAPVGTHWLSSYMLIRREATIEAQIRTPLDASRPD